MAEEDLARQPGIPCEFCKAPDSFVTFCDGAACYECWLKSMKAEEMEELRGEES